MGAAHMIYGIGKSQRQAIQNAMQQIGGNEFTPVVFDYMRCAPELYAVIDQPGRWT